MRHLFLVILLIGAAFLGGAFVNGPGLQWVQARLMKSLGLGESNEIASVQLKASPANPSPSTPQAPIAPAPSIVGEAVATAATLASVKSPAGLMDTAQVSPPRSIQTPGFDRRKPLSVAPVKGADDREIRPASLKGTRDSVADIKLEEPDQGPLPPLQPVHPEPATAGTKLPPASSLARSTEWAEILHKLKSLGVTRYRVDGDLAGRVLFSCVVPIAGRQAVSQQFEAEDDDLLSAAQAAVRRVTLWKKLKPTDTN